MTGRAIMSMALRKLFEDLKGLRPVGLSKDAEADYRALRQVLVSFLPGNPGAIASLLRSPAVATPLRCLRNGVGDPNTLVREIVCQSFFQLALQNALPDAQQVRLVAPRLMSPLLGRSATATDGFSNGMESTGATFHQLTEPDPDKREAPTWLSDLDNNPLRFDEAHPDKEGNDADFGSEAPAAWGDSLRQALALMDSVMPALGREARLFVRQIVPVGYDAHRHLSATYQEAIGTLYLSLHPDPMTMVEAVIHELSHTKLNALLELDPVLQNHREEAYPSPVRPDPRPLHGVLLAVHAFVPVAYLYERMMEKGHPLAESARFQERHTQIVAGNRDGADVLRAHAKPTKVGAGLMDELYRYTGA